MLDGLDRRKVRSRVAMITPLPMPYTEYSITIRPNTEYLKAEGRNKKKTVKYLLIFLNGERVVSFRKCNISLIYLKDERKCNITKLFYSEIKKGNKSNKT